jgi:protein arginine N-methyltransferase 1
MLTDEPRMAAYTEALRRAVRPGSTVIDLGAGPGVLALLACRFGAGRVHAVEPDDSVLLLAELAAANGFENRISIHRALSTQVHLPEPADVIVSDLRGVLPLFEQHIPSIIDARRRLLADGGVLIPRADTMWAALVNAPETFRKFREPWTENRLGLDLSAGRRYVTNSWLRVELRGEQLLTPPQQWVRLDYAAVDGPDAAGTLEWVMERAGTAHGVAVWFDADLAEGIGFSNAPGEPKTIYGQAFFPWPEPVELHPGDRVSVNLRAVLSGDDSTWRWRSRITHGAGQAAACFDQSTFFGRPLAAGMLRRREAGFMPSLSPDGEIDSFLLAQMDGRTTLEEIAHRAVERFPERFPDWRDALTRAGELAERYSRGPDAEH